MRTGQKFGGKWVNEWLPDESDKMQVYPLRGKHNGSFKTRAATLITCSLKQHLHQEM